MLLSPRTLPAYGCPPAFIVAPVDSEGFNGLPDLRTLPQIHRKRFLEYRDIPPCTPYASTLARSALVMSMLVPPPAVRQDATPSSPGAIPHRLAGWQWLPIAELIRYQASEFYKKNGGIGYLFNADELLLGRVDRIHKQTAFTNKKDAQQKCLSMNHRLFLQVKYSNQALMKGDSSPQLDKMTV